MLTDLSNGGLAQDLAPGSAVPIPFSQLHVYGHSITTGGGTTSPDRQAFVQVAGALRCQLSLEGQGGAIAADDEFLYLSQLSANGRGGWNWVLASEWPARIAASYGPTPRVICLNFGLNDALFHARDSSGDPRATWKSAIRTMLSRSVASRIFEDTDASIAYSGPTWPAAISHFPNWIGGSGTGRRPIPTSGTPVVTITLPADFEGGAVALGWTIGPGATGTITLTGTASVVTAGGALNNAAYNIANTAYVSQGGTGDKGRNSANGYVIRIPGLVASDAGKTIIATITGMSTTSVATASAPGAITTAGTAGAVTYTYEWVAGTFAGGDGIPSGTTSIATGNATLSTTNYNIIPAPTFPTNADYMKLVRTVGGLAGGVVKIIYASAIVNDQSPYPAQSSFTASAANPSQHGFAFDYWQIEASNPVQRAIVIGLYRPLSYSSGVGTVTDTDVANYNADLLSVVGEFARDQVLLIDVDTALNKNTAYFSPDNLHPNDRGHTVYAATIIAAVTEWVQRWPLIDQAAHSRTLRNAQSRNVQIWRPGLPGAKDYLVTSTTPSTPQVIDTVNFSSYVEAEAGDMLMVTLAMLTGTQAQNLVLDAATVNPANGAIVNCMQSPELTRTAIQLSSTWFAPSATAASVPIGGTIYYIVRPEDLFQFTGVSGMSGVVCVRLIGIVGNATGRTIYAGGVGTSPAAFFGVWNIDSGMAPGTASS